LFGHTRNNISDNLQNQISNKWWHGKGATKQSHFVNHAYGNRCIMVKGYEVLEMLIPNGGYIMVGDDYEGIEFVECEPITKQEFEAGFAKVEKFKADSIKAIATEKAALLAKLGITDDEAKLLLS
jgi:hypothetical protein